MVKKVFGRTKRYRPVKTGRHRKRRPKSFKSEEAAKVWAKSKGIERFSLKNLRNPESKEKKIIVVQE